MANTPPDVPPAAVKVLQAFLDAGARQDEPAMKACLTRATIESGSFNSAGSQGMTFAMGQGHMEGDIAVIPVAATPQDAPPGTPPAMELPCRMVQEAGAWKFDLEGTMERMLGGQLDAALDQVTGALAEGMQGLATAMAEGLNQAFGATTPAEAAPPAETKPTQAKKKKAAKKGHR